MKRDYEQCIKERKIKPIEKIDDKSLNLLDKFSDNFKEHGVTKEDIKREIKSLRESK